MWCDAAYFHSLESCPLSQVLRLGENNISDSGVEALADVCARGALPVLQALYLQSNDVGDAGLASFADACNRGALADLRVRLHLKHVHHRASFTPSRPLFQILDVSKNQIGTLVSRRSQTCADGALLDLRILDLTYNNNRISSESLCELSGAIDDARPHGHGHPMRKAACQLRLMHLALEF